MNTEKELLIEQIEIIRAELNTMAKDYNLTDSIVISLSQQLDTLLNRYYRLT
ncbi:aspartyl-phosphate phosphatase Spo0E family protein [Brevibacillus choshinensis]|uniref:Aspartyl-phosphate phosphatase Spo0E family protein n=1 Tax=Brevibacillus choshinensis TaxID=54911 RepID=A0ABX7FS99_BRECH|nr:aspartyl-phosphate phosphatase Spo0E family protein [Brevibacillus choshinensis]QRG68579.1 aspartyl-phosphate phosphatase Spo0E family protein [Brevibacillus choshinensis]